MSYYGTSILELLKRVETETGAKKADTYLYLAVEHKPSNPQAALKFAEKALAICREGNFKAAEIDYWTVRAILEEGVSASERAVEHLQKAVALAEEIGDEQGRLTALQKIGLHKLRQHKAGEAGEILMRCVEDYKHLPDSLMKAECFHQAAQYLTHVDLKAAAEMALQGIEVVKHAGKPRDAVNHLKMLMNISLKTGDENKAIEYGLEVLRIKDEANDQTSLLGVAKQLGTLFNKQGNSLQARAYFEREIALHHASVNAHRTALLQQSDAETYFYAGRKEEALQFAQAAVDVAVTENNPRKLGTALFQLGQLLFLNHSFAEAIEPLKQSIASKGESIPANDHIATLELLHTCYEQTNAYEQAYHTLVQKNKLEAELMNTERLQQVALLNKRYETEKREVELRELKLQQTESELKAIKAQMNPHFIFNALNSIQEMFFIGDKRLANEHLGKFSQLTRDILKASGKQFITLTEETEMLTKYLELEGLRFEKDFSFRISVNDEDAADDILLPPMLIQPYVENAIRHGLLHQTGEKKIAVHFHFDEEKSLLTCTVEDNGIGRAASTKINAHRNPLHESFSTSANAKRLELLNQNRAEKIGVQYEDLEQGARVLLTIPVKF